MSQTTHNPHYYYPPANTHGATRDYQSSKYGHHEDVVVSVPDTAVRPPPSHGGKGAPDTTCGLVTSILVTIFCAWPCGIGAIVANRKANTLVKAGAYAEAKTSLRHMLIWIVVAVIVGIAAWTILGIRLKALLDNDDSSGSTIKYYTGVGR